MGTALKMLSELRETAKDPAHGAGVNRERAETLRENVRPNQEWEACSVSTMTEDEYRERVLPPW